MTEFSVWNVTSHYYESDIALYRAEAPKNEYEIFLSQRGEAVKEDFNNPHAQFWLDPFKLAWYLTSARNITMFMQVRKLFVKQIEIKAGCFKRGKNHHATWANGVWAKLKAEAELEVQRLHANVSFG